MANKNLLVIMPDQLRADYLSCYNHKTINTANIDQLAKDGVKFNNTYCAAPLCGPSRISFATSTYFSEHNRREYAATITCDVPNIVSVLKNKGYKTGMFGKNHLFHKHQLKDIWDDLEHRDLGNAPRHPDNKYAFSSGVLEPGHEYNITEKLTERAIDFMKNNKEENFITWINYQDPHPFYMAPEPYASMFDPDEMELPESYNIEDEKLPHRCRVWKKHAEMNLCSEKDMKKAMAMYMGQIRYIDDMVGRLSDFLDESGLADSTMVVFMSDHGELLGDFGMVRKLPVFYECLTRIPLIIKNPHSNWKVQEFNGLVEEVDLAPTILTALGLEYPKTMVGKDLTNDLIAGIDKGKETIICEAGFGASTWKKPDENLKLRAPFPPSPFGPAAMIREGALKLSFYHDDECQLFDLDKDPHEMNNLYNNKEYRDIVNDLQKKLLQRLLSVKVRDIDKLKWDYDYNGYINDPRRNPLEVSEKNK